MGKQKDAQMREAHLHARRPDTGHESPAARVHIEVDISLCLKWPCGSIRASPTQIKSTQLEALLKAILCSGKIGIKLPGSPPLSEEHCQVRLDISAACTHTSVRGKTEVTQDQSH